MNIRLFAKKGGWFKEGTEVFNENNESFKLKDWSEALRGSKMLLVKGIRVCDGRPGEDRVNCKSGDEYEDFCWCSISEFQKVE